MKNDLKPEMNKKYNTIAAYALGVALIVVLFVMFFVFLSPISAFASKILGLMSPFFYGFALAYILCPVCNFFDGLIGKALKKTKRLGGVKRHAGLILTYIAFLLFITLFIYIIVPQLVASVNSFSSNYSTYLKGLSKFFDNVMSTLEFVPQSVVSEMEKSITDLLNSSVQIVSQISPMILNAFTNVAMSLWNMVLGFVISIYMLSERKNFARQLGKLTYAIFPKKAAEGIVGGAQKAHVVFGGFVNGKLLDSLIIGILCFVGLTCLRMPYTALVSIIVGVTNFIPYFGPFLGAIPSFIIIFLNDPLKSLWFVIFILVLQQIDGNIIGPKILKQTIGVSSFWIIFSLLVMGGLYGVTGMVLAVPLFALCYMGIGKLCNNALERKGHPEIKQVEAETDKKDASGKEKV